MRKVLSYYKIYIPLIIVILIALMCQVWCELSLPNYMSDIINNGIVAGDMNHIKTVGIVMSLVAAGAALSSIIGNLFASLTAAKAARRIRRDIFKAVTEFGAQEYNEFSTASLITRSTNDVQMVQQATVMMLRMLLFAPIMGAGAVVMALKTCQGLSWTIGIALVCVLGLMIFSFIVIFPRFKVMQEKLDKINLIMKERLSGTLVVRAFRTERHEEERFDEANKDLTNLYIFVNKALAFMMPTMTLIMSAVSVLIVWAGAHMVSAGQLLIGDMLAYLQYAMHVIMSFMFVTMIFVMLPRAVVSAKRIGQVLDTEVSVRDPKEAVPVQAKAIEEEKAKAIDSPETKAKGIVEFKNVSFAYPGAEGDALTNISFTAMPGETTAIIGGTGSSKTTLINLIPRFYDVTDGEILIDGIDVRQMNRQELRKRIGLVPQKGMLFGGTIRSNLLYGNEEASEEELYEAVETAQAMEFIEEKAQGLDEEISQGGANVSGGQKQRLCIARALIKKPDIYIFDDSFSALDFSTDKALRKALSEKVANSTFIIVAQRINTILEADRIIVLDEGKIAGDGTHRELLRSNRVYREIAFSQLSEEELKEVK